MRNLIYVIESRVALVPIHPTPVLKLEDTYLEAGHALWLGTVKEDDDQEKILQSVYNRLLKMNAYTLLKTDIYALRQDI